MQINRNFLAATWIFIAALSRIIPHIPNVTPFTALSLFAGSQFSKRISILLLLFALLISDLALAYIYDYPVFGSWTLFTYTGFLVITLLSNKLTFSPSWLRLVIFTLFASLGFWLWTNFGTWLLSGLYPKTMVGFITCYEMALPFLRNSLIGNLAWMVIIFGIFRTVVIFAHRHGKIA